MIRTIDSHSASGTNSSSSSSTNSDIQITTIDLLRHGECEGGQRYRGSWDVALSAAGHRQMMQSLSSANPQWHAVVTSPLIRCAHIAKEIADSYSLPLHTEQDLREINFGEWEGQSIDYVWKTQRTLVEAWGNDPVQHAPPGGENAAVFSARVLEGFNRVIEQHKGQHILLVSHGGVMRALLAHTLSMPLIALNRLEVPFACFSQLHIIHTQDQCYYKLLRHNVHLGHAVR